LGGQQAIFTPLCKLTEAVKTAGDKNWFAQQLFHKFCNFTGEVGLIEGKNCLKMASDFSTL